MAAGRVAGRATFDPQLLLQLRLGRLLGGNSYSAGFTHGASGAQGFYTVTGADPGAVAGGGAWRASSTAGAAGPASGYNPYSPGGPVAGGYDPRYGGYQPGSSTGEDRKVRGFGSVAPGYPRSEYEQARGQGRRIEVRAREAMAARRSRPGVSFPVNRLPIGEFAERSGDVHEVRPGSELPRGRNHNDSEARERGARLR